MALVAGVDFGTQSVRVSIVDSARGALGWGVSEYPVKRDRNDPDFATQSHESHMRALVLAMKTALDASKVPGASIEAIALDTTGSTVVPVGRGLVPLDDYYLWCDHRAHEEAALITRVAKAECLGAIDACGGVYSSEWGFAKLLHWLRHNPDKRGSLVGARDLLRGRYLTSEQLAGTLSTAWAKKLGLREGIPIPVGAFDAHWDAIGAGIAEGDVVNVVGTASCIMAIARQTGRIPGLCGVVNGSIHPQYVGIEAGLSATGYLFEALAARSGKSVAELSKGMESFRAGQTGLLHLSWDNGDRTVLVNPNLGGVTLGWNLNHTAQDHLFAAIEGTAFHTRVILERMAEHGVPINRVIHGGGIPQKNEVLNQVYANVLDKPVLVPERSITSLGSAIFAFLAAETFKTIEEAQKALCPPYRAVQPDSSVKARYDRLFVHWRSLYFAMGSPASDPISIGGLLPGLRAIE